MTAPNAGNRARNTDQQTRPGLDLNGFLPRPENRSAIKAIARIVGAVLAGKRVRHCPLVLHGAPGTGKTHLTTAAIQTLVGRDGERGITARSIAAGELARPDEREGEQGFADRDLLACDFLVVEDVHHLPGRAESDVCELIDHRVAHRKALVVTALAGPARLAKLSRRLTSRLAAGLVIQMEPPGRQSKKAVLSAAAREHKIRLTPEALDWLARRTSGMRGTLGLLQNLAQVAPDHPGRLDQQAVERILAETGQPTSTSCDPGAILKRVADVFGVTEKELLGTSRLRNVLVPRQVAMYLTRELTKLSYPRIGAFFAGRDHTTVLHACQKVERELEGNVTLAATIRQVKAELG